MRTLPDHRLLDRAVRGRAWIAVLGVMLAGIVAMQVEVLKLGASLGRSMQRTGQLQNRNETLRQDVATLDDDQRIEQLASKMGMVMPAPSGVGFLSAAPSNIGAAIANIKPPDSQTFLAQTPSNGAIATATNTLPAGSAGAIAAAAVGPSTGTSAGGSTGSPAGATPTATSPGASTTGTGATSPTAAAGTAGTAGTSPSTGTSPSAGTTPTAGGTQLPVGASSPTSSPGTGGAAIGG